MRSKLTALLVITIAILSFWAVPAQAHAELLTTDPTSGQILERAPGSLTFRFSEPVTLTQDAIRLYSSAGEVQELPPVTHSNGDDSAITVPITELDKGTWVVVWRIVSADSHPIHGAITFQVGNVSGDTSRITASLLAGDHADLSVRAIQGTLRGLMLGATVIGLGALLLSVAFRNNEALFDLAYRTTGYSFLTLGIATVFGLFSQGIYVNAAPLTEFFNPNIARDTLHTRYGYGCLLRFAAVASLALVLPEVKDRTAWRFAALAAGLSVVASFAVAGHAGTGRASWLGLTLDVTHITAGSIWFGGLFLFVLTLLRSSVDVESTRRGLARFSKIAFACAMTVVLSGVLQGIRQIESMQVLLNTAYGRLVIAKTVLYMTIIAIAWFSRRATKKWTSKASTQEIDQRKSLRISIGLEVLVAAAIVTLTTILIATSPTPSAIPLNDSPAGTQVPGSPFDQSTKAGDANVRLKLPRTTSGPASFDAVITDANGQPLDVPDVKISITLPSAGIGPLPITLTKLGPGQYATQTEGTVVPIAGKWNVSVTVRTTEIDQTATTFVVNFS